MLSRVLHNLRSRPFHLPSLRCRVASFNPSALNVGRPRGILVGRCTLVETEAVIRLLLL